MRGMATLLKSLTVHQFRDVAAETTLRFRDSINVLLGKNATGKTTLLNLIAAACSLNFRAFAREPFAVSFLLVSGDSVLDVHLANARQASSSDPASVDDVTQRLAQGILSPRVSLSLSVGGTVRFRSTIAKGKVVQEIDGQSMDERPVEVPVLDNHLLLATLFGSTRPTREFFVRARTLLAPLWNTTEILRLDESLGYFDDVVTGDSAAIRVMGAGKGEFHAFGDNVPAEIVEAAVRLVRRRPESATLQIRDVPILRTLAQQMGFRSASLYAQRAEKSADSDGPWSASYSSFRFEFTRHDGSTIDHKWLSYGQKRLVGFYYWLGAYPGFAIADELVNGLHHAWIDNCIAALHGRQAFLTTQNPLLLDYLPFESEGDVAESFVVCKSGLEDGTETIHWQNIGERESHGFYRAYKAGIQHVSEILATRGLW
jgi:energy-coupling factor transporter ATP-binding protein EcfA2